jgi:hypothetical protein
MIILSVECKELKQDLSNIKLSIDVSDRDNDGGDGMMMVMLIVGMMVRVMVGCW